MTNVLYSHNEATEKVLTVFDNIFEKTNQPWARNTGERVDLERYSKVHELLSLYNTTKKSLNAQYDLINIDNVNNKTLERLRNDIDNVKIGTKPIRDITIDDLRLQLSNETMNEVRREYWAAGNELKNKLKIPFDASEDGTVTAKKITTPEGVDVPNISKYNDLLDTHAGTLKITVLSGQDAASRRSVRELAAENNMTVKEYDAAIGKVMDNFITSFGV